MRQGLDSPAHHRIIAAWKRSRIGKGRAGAARTAVGDAATARLPSLRWMARALAEHAAVDDALPAWNAGVWETAIRPD